MWTLFLACTRESAPADSGDTAASITDACRFGGVLTGTVTGRPTAGGDPAPLPGAEVTAWTSGESTVSVRTFTDEEGGFSMELTAEHWTVTSFWLDPAHDSWQCVVSATPVCAEALSLQATCGGVD